MSRYLTMGWSFMMMVTRPTLGKYLCSGRRRVSMLGRHAADMMQHAARTLPRGP